MQHGGSVHAVIFWSLGLARYRLVFMYSVSHPGVMVVCWACELEATSSRPARWFPACRPSTQPSRPDSSH